MQITNTIKDQGFVDLIIQVYGTRDALEVFLNNNISGDFQLDAVLPQRTWQYDIENDAADKKALRKLKGAFIKTYHSTVIPLSGLQTEDGINITTEDGQLILS